MASSSTKRSLSNRGPSLPLLALVCTVYFSLTGAELIRLRGEVGGNVTFPCPVDNQRTIHLFYFQRDKVFLNGYHASKEIDSQIWNNTRVDRPGTNVFMCRLNISHNGLYKCIIQYANLDIIEKDIQLTVTASYSKPNVTQSCDDARCLVTCASYGGYPGAKVAWTIHGSKNQLWNVENNTQVPSPSTKLFNSTSTVYFNCSHGQMGNLSCSVGNVTSNWFLVCKPEVQPISHIPMEIIVPVVCIVFGVLPLAVCLLWRLHKRRQTGKDCTEKGNNEELKELKV